MPGVFVATVAFTDAACWPQERWLEHLLTGLPGGVWGFLLFVNLFVFFIAFFLDFFEIAFIIVPLLAPVALKMLAPVVGPEAALIWFGVMLCVNMQTSFMHPPFGFALFYLRSVAARSDYKDRITGEAIPAVTTAQIYKGSIAFICLQLVMVAAVIAFPSLVTGGIEKTVEIPLYYRKNVELVGPAMGNFFANGTQAGPTWNAVDWYVKS